LLRVGNYSKFALFHFPSIAFGLVKPRMRRQHIATGVSLWSNAIKNEAAIAAAGMVTGFN
jgi:hypothetical protein